MESNSSNQPLPSRINHVAISETNLEHAVNGIKKSLDLD